MERLLQSPVFVFHRIRHEAAGLHLVNDSLVLTIQFQTEKFALLLEEIHVRHAFAERVRILLVLSLLQCVGCFVRGAGCPGQRNGLGVSRQHSETK